MFIKCEEHLQIWPSHSSETIKIKGTGRCTYDRVPQLESDTSRVCSVSNLIKT